MYEDQEADLLLIEKCKAKQELYSLKVDLADAQLESMNKMLWYLDQIRKDEDLKVIKGDLDLVQVFILKELILQDQVKLAEYNLAEKEAQLELSEDQEGNKGTE